MIQHAAEQAKADYEARAQVGKRIKELVPLARFIQKPKGIFRKSCPQCGTRIHAQRWVFDGIVADIYVKLYECPVCDYARATEKIHPLIG